MAIHTSVFHSFARSSSDADAWGRVDGTAANDPTDTEANVGFTNKAFGKDMWFTRHDLAVPTSGPAIITNRIIVRKAQVEFKVHTTAIVDGSLGFARFGIMEPVGAWLFDDIGFNPSSYPLLGDLPYPSGADDLLIDDMLFNDTYLVGAAGDSLIYTPATFFAGATITVGEGYTAGTHPNLYTNFASELTDYCQNNSGSVRPLGIVLDTKLNPPAADEMFVVHSSDSVGEPGLVLTIEWDDLQAAIVAKDHRAGSRVRAPESSARNRISADVNAQERIFAARQAGPRVKAARARATARVMAPLSGIRTRE